MNTTNGPVHTYFGLSYANYHVMHRTLMQSMPLEWQERMVGLLNEYDAAFDHVEKPDCFNVEAAEERCVDELSEAELRMIGCSREDFEDENDDGFFFAVYDKSGSEIEPGSRVTFPVYDPVPHYKRGYVEPEVTAHVQAV